jgi:hypothetical protein
MQTVQGSDIVSFSKLDDNGCLRSKLHISEDSPAGYLSVQTESADKLILSWISNIEPGTAVKAAGLPDYVVSNNMLYKNLPNNMRSTVFEDSDTVELAGVEIPVFTRKYQTLMQEFGDTSAKVALEPSAVFIDANSLMLTLSCNSDIKNGVGKVFAVPMLQHPGGMMSAKGVSEGIEEGYSYVGGKWAAEETLQKLGIGPLGRLIDGTPLEPILLRPEEILYRGGNRLAGPCRGILFDESK